MALPLTIDDLPLPSSGPEPTADWPPRLRLVPPLTPSALFPSASRPSAAELVAPSALPRAVYRRRGWAHSSPSDCSWPSVSA